VGNLTIFVSGIDKLSWFRRVWGKGQLVLVRGCGGLVGTHISLVGSPLQQVNCVYLTHRAKAIFCCRFLLWTIPTSGTCVFTSCWVGGTYNSLRGVYRLMKRPNLG